MYFFVWLLLCGWSVTSKRFFLSFLFSYFWITVFKCMRSEDTCSSLTCRYYLRERANIASWYRITVVESWHWYKSMWKFRERKLFFSSSVSYVTPSQPVLLMNFSSCWPITRRYFCSFVTRGVNLTLLLAHVLLFRVVSHCHTEATQPPVGENKNLWRTAAKQPIQWVVLASVCISWADQSPLVLCFIEWVV